jgi:hypothetical protein
MAKRLLLFAVALVAVVAGTANAVGAGRLPYFVGCSPSHSQIRPRSIVVACGDGNFYVTGIKWSRWDATTAFGIGTGHQNDCRPDCAGGHFHTYLVSIHLSRPVACKSGRREFTRLTYRFLSRKPPRVLRGDTVREPFFSGSGCP